MLHIYRPPAFISWQTDCTLYLLPFDTHMWYLLVTDAAQYWSQRSQMTFWIVCFFQSQRIICLTMATNATPGTLMEPWVVAACLLRSHLPQTNCVFVCVCVCGCERRWVSEWMCVPVCLHVQGHACGRTCSERCLANHPQSAGCLELSLIAAWLASCLDARGTFFLLYRMNQH